MKSKMTPREALDLLALARGHAADIGTRAYQIGQILGRLKREDAHDLLGYRTWAAFVRTSFNGMGCSRSHALITVAEALPLEVVQKIGANKAYQLARVPEDLRTLMPDANVTPLRVMEKAARNILAANERVHHGPFAKRGISAATTRAAAAKRVLRAHRTVGDKASALVEVLAHGTKVEALALARELAAELNPIVRAVA